MHPHLAEQAVDSFGRCDNACRFELAFPHDRDGPA